MAAQQITQARGVEGPVAAASLSSASKMCSWVATVILLTTSVTWLALGVTQIIILDKAQRRGSSFCISPLLNAIYRVQICIGPFEIFARFLLMTCLLDYRMRRELPDAQ